ncbi:MAG: ribosomal protein S5 [Patescibacteria group bacterium]
MTTEEQNNTQTQGTGASPDTTETTVQTPEATKQATPTTEDSKVDTTKDASPTSSDGAKGSERGDRSRAPARGRGRGGPRRSPRREKSEFDQKIISLRRVTRVMAGGRRFSFSAAVVIGDKKGRVGFGIGKAGDTAMAIDKAVRMAKKDMVHIKRTENNSIPYDTQAKYKASAVLLRPVWGKGLAAGGAVRVVLEMAGIDEVGGKLLSRSKSNINNAKATLEALKPFAYKK